MDLAVNLARQSLLSYRALFHWLNAPAYISNVFLKPVLQVILFAFVGRFAADPEAAQAFAIGIAGYAIPVILIGGLTQVFSNELWFGTLTALFASPGNRVVTYFARAGMHIPNGLLCFAMSLITAGLVAGVSFGATHWPALIAAALAIAFSCAMYALCAGNFAIITRDWGTVLTIAHSLTLIFSGAIVPLDWQPEPLRVVSGLLPLTHGLAALRAAITGTLLPNELLLELAVGFGYAVVGVLIFRWIEVRAKRTGSYERSEV